MKVSRSGNFISALPAFGVMFGVLNHRFGSAPGSGTGSISNPPENSGPIAANDIGSRGVWQPTQFDTYRAMYSPRSFVGPGAGVLDGGLIVMRGLKTVTTLLMTLPMSVHSLGGTSFRTGFCARRYESTAARSSSLMLPNGIIGSIVDRPSGFTAHRSIRASCASVVRPVPVPGSGG